MEIVEFQSASDQSVAYEAGELDGMMTGYDRPVSGSTSPRSDGMKTVAMAFGGDASEGRFIVASSPDSEITEPAQLAGTRIGISENTMMEYLVGCYLEDLGVDLESVELVNILKLTPAPGPAHGVAVISRRRSCRTRSRSKPSPAAAWL